MTSYVLGLLFDMNLERVVLISKTRPAWQEGKLNGVGGHIEPGESPEHAMSREFREESGFEVPVSWKPFGRLFSKGQWEVMLFYAVTGEKLPTHYSEEGLVSPVRFRGELDRINIVPNLQYLIPMALNHLVKLDKCKFFEIEESEEPTWMREPATTRNE